MSGANMPEKRVVRREHFLAEESEKIIQHLEDISTWTSWMKSTSHIISSTQKNLEKGDEFELQRIIKGALIQEKWSVSEVRISNSTPKFYELMLTLDAQSRMGKAVGGAVKNLSLAITVLSDERQSGAEICIDYTIKGGYRLAAKWVRGSVEQMAKSWLLDLTGIIS